MDNIVLDRTHQYRQVSVSRPGPIRIMSESDLFSRYGIGPGWTHYGTLRDVFSTILLVKRPIPPSEREKYLRDHPWLR